MIHEDYIYSDLGHKLRIYDRVNENAFLTALAIIAGVAGAAVGAASAIRQGEAADKSAKYNAAVSSNNAQIAVDQSKYEADRLRKRNLLLMSKQRSTYAKGNVVTGGTPEDVMFDTSTEGELDVLAAMYSGRINSASLNAQAKLHEYEGNNAKSASYYSASASVLGGVTSVTSAVSSYKVSKTRNPSFTNN
jgi:hypothetical protein